MGLGPIVLQAHLNNSDVKLSASKKMWCTTTMNFLVPPFLFLKKIAQIEKPLLLINTVKVILVVGFVFGKATY